MKPPETAIPYTLKDCPHCGVFNKITVVDTAKMRTIRKKSNHSLRSVARDIGISASYLSDMELGRRSMSTEIAAKILETIKE